MNAPVKHPVRTVKSITQAGLYGGPRLDLFGLKSAWVRFASERELRRLARLHLRIERRKEAIRQIHSERELIMNRCIRRMRRSKGLD